MRQLVNIGIALAVITLSSLSVPSYAQTTPEIARGNCKSCATACQKAADHCNEVRGQLGQDSVTNALKDCINACKMTEDYLVRGSYLSQKSAALAVDACNACAKSCDRFKSDLTMVSCANECRKTVGNLQKVAAGQ